MANVTGLNGAGGGVSGASAAIIGDETVGAARRAGMLAGWMVKAVEAATTAEIMILRIHMHGKRGKITIKQ